MVRSGEKMRLGAFLSVPGHHVASWRYPDAATDQLLDFELYKRIAQIAERGKFDMVFFADILAAAAKNDAQITHMVNTRFDPMTLLPAMAAATDKIGLAATVSTTYNEPYHVARKFSTLDHISKGRAAWNLVTSSNEDEAFNFSKDNHLLHELRYQRAGEFVDVVTGLWDSWEDDALVMDKESGIFAEKEKLHVLDYKGTHFAVRGPLNVARPPQGHPVVVQAGSSEDGKELAARTADVVFTAWQTLEEAKGFYDDLKGRLKQYGRSPESLKIMPGVFPIIGQTEAEAKQKAELLRNLIPPAAGVGLLSRMIGVDLSKYPLDEPLPELPSEDAINGGKSRHSLLKNLAKREGLTIRQLYQRIAGARGHREILGTPTQIADQLEAWFHAGAADGFNIMPPYFPGGLEDFVELVIPELQNRGLFRTDYEGNTLRENLGLSRSPNQFAKDSSHVI
ncbi:LLM class flavin-dependent oxidoreductase [Alicyclobacillus fastidiosus]|uniref:LLM class flavin-dependent oxidoreductase n=1 Tax=Alicyclobacillus fastidiosus TaxID=392011 RepID=A0ABV5AAJ5_9BACL|nr:LLM class flavin-dependent oxidoreductase [Alicyclobacillus fastidiosus]WEH07743.1 LLM class flavin-dependent oxidoreductase [Alicyclobacillus fastidiosus]